MYSSRNIYYTTQTLLQTLLNLFDRGIVHRYEEWEQLRIRWSQIPEAGLYRLNLFVMRHRVKVLLRPCYLPDDEVAQAKAIWNLVEELNTEISVMGMFMKNYKDVDGYLGELNSEVVYMQKLDATIYRIMQYTIELRKIGLDISRFVHRRIGFGKLPTGLTANITYS